jgi:TRAP-type C4-dicarboxylate transport system substrate-binding protein
MKMLKQVLAAIGVAGVLATASAKAQTRIVLNNYVPPAHLMSSDILPTWGKEVERVTQGRVKVEIPPAPLASGPDSWNAVSTGIVDAAWQMVGFVPNRARLAQISTLPWVHLGDSEASSVAYWRIHQRYFAGANEFNDVQLLTLFVAPGGELSSATDKSINSVGELKGRRIFALPPTPSETMRALGIPVVSGPATGISDFLSRGVADSYWGITLESTLMFRASPYTKSITIIPRKLFAASFAMFVNKSSWAKISEADRKAIMEVSGETLARRIGRVWNDVELKSKRQLIESGVKFLSADPAFVEALKSANKGLTETWLRTAKSMGINGEEALAYFLAEIERESKFKL